MNGQPVTRRRAIHQLGAGAAAVALLTTGALPAVASAPTTDMGCWDGPKVDLKTRSRDELLTVLQLASAMGRVMTDDEVEELVYGAADPLDVVDAGTLSGRLDALVGRPLSWLDLPQDRRDAGLIFAVAMTRESTLPLFSNLHTSLARGRARQAAVATA
jgi:hypothetical protein